MVWSCLRCLSVQSLASVTQILSMLSHSDSCHKLMAETDNDGSGPTSFKERKKKRKMRGRDSGVGGGRQMGSLVDKVHSSHDAACCNPFFFFFSAGIMAGSLCCYSELESLC